MQTYELVVKERAVRPNSKDMTLVRTSVGVDQIHVMFDSEEWAEFPIINVTFSQGPDKITLPLSVTRLPESSDWTLEATCLVPWEVIDTNGPIKVTFQGRDESGRHIITAKGSPLAVEEAGDVVEGVAPSDTVPLSELEIAYARVIKAIEDVDDLLDDFRNRIDDIVQGEIDDLYGPATETELGLIKVGDGLDITEDGTLSSSGLSDEYADIIKMLRLIASGIASYTYEDGSVSDLVIKDSVLPLATDDSAGAIRPDGTTVTVDDNGVLHASGEYTLPPATLTNLGGVMPDGITITVDSDGTIHGSTSYTLPIATTEALGGVRPDGRTITIDANGVITASGGGGDGSYILPVASASQLGGVKVDNTTVTADPDGTLHCSFSYTLPVASEDRLGGVKPDGTTITVDPDGTMHGTSVYELPAATAESLGGVKPDGETITVDEDGTIHGNSAYELPSATSEELGGVKVDGVSIVIDDTGVIHSPLMGILPATTEIAGKVRPDGDSISVEEDGTIHAIDQTRIATYTVAGKVIPDGLTITVDEDGTIHAAGRYELPMASAETLGGVKVDGTTITIDENGTISGVEQYVLPPATADTLGGVKPDGETITVDDDGTIHGVEQYELPPATEHELGGVKVGWTINVDPDGTINVPAAIDGDNGDWGTVWPDGDTLYVGDDNQLHVMEADEHLPGIVRPDGDTIVVDGGVISVAYEFMTDELIDELTPFDYILPYKDEEEY